MMTASYYLRRKDFVESDRYLTILREEYPDSPHLKDAFELGSHVRLMSYDGPYYDGSSLDGAAQLTAQTLNLFPDAESRPQMRQSLQKMYNLKAQRRWKEVEFYEAKGNDRAVGIACIQLIKEYPDTKHADLARKRLEKIDRRELQGLPQIDQLLSSLRQPTTQPASEQRPPTKSVSDPSGETTGRVRI